MRARLRKNAGENKNKKAAIGTTEARCEGVAKKTIKGATSRPPPFSLRFVPPQNGVNPESAAELLCRRDRPRSPRGSWSSRGPFRALSDPHDLVSRASRHPGSVLTLSSGSTPISFPPQRAKRRRHATSRRTARHITAQAGMCVVSVPAKESGRILLLEPISRVEGPLSSPQNRFSPLPMASFSADQRLIAST